jgi:D-alanine-D-alanine ligase-like ATP-grasp enzyme
MSFNSMLVRKYKFPYSSELIAEIAPEIGAEVWIEPEFWYVGMITFANGRRHLFRKGKFNINPVWAATIAKDKGYTSMFLRKFWYLVVDGQTFFSDEKSEFYGVNRWIEDWWQYAQKLGLPVIIKPNDLSEGEWVEKISQKEDYLRASQYILWHTDAYRIESFFSGNDYRIVVLDNDVISAYQRIPFTLIGDGISSISTLFELEMDHYQKIERPIHINITDARIQRNIKLRWYTHMSIPEKWVSLQLLDNANLTTGGKSLDCTTTIHEDFKSLAIRSTHDMGLRLCGVDIMTQDITQPQNADNSYVIIEMNSSPGLDNYIATWETQKSRVKDMYRKILLALSQL